MNVPTLPQHTFEAGSQRNEFDTPYASTDALAEMKETGLGPEWSWIRNPDPSRYVLLNGSLRIYGSPADLNETVCSPAFVGVRQKDVDFLAETCVSLGNARGGDKAGLTVFMDSGAHYDIYATADGKVGILYAMGVHNHREEFKVGKGRRIWLRVTGEADYYRLWYSTDGKEFKQAGINHTRYMSSETVGGFTGVMTGLWMQSPSGKGFADFEYFEYIPN